MKILYKPFGIIAGIISTRVGKSIFKNLWARIDPEDPPEPTAGDGSIHKVVGAAVLRAGTMAGVSATFDRATAQTFHYFTGIWPGGNSKEEKEKEKEKEKS